MRIECVEAFTDASVKALAAMLGDEFGPGAPRLCGVEERRGGVTVHVRISGAVSGHAALNIDEQTALRLYARATGERHERLPALGVDYFLELGNVISGAAASALNEQGIAVTVQPPELIAPGDGWDHGDVEACLIPVYSLQGGILIQVVLAAG